MNVEKPTLETDLCSIPGEFRENYRFLTELINCEHKNNSISQDLEALVEKRLCRLRGKLNRRQMKILSHFLKEAGDRDTDSLDPPVPAELEASIRIRKRSTWLPWEAEALRKIDRWRDDIHCIMRQWSGDFSVPSDMRPAVVVAARLRR
jgi:hypothetical protein